MSDVLVRSGEIQIAVRDHSDHSDHSGDGGDGSPSGPPVLLLHGAGGTLLSWGDFPQRLTGAHRVLAMDLRGHGLSGDGPFTVESVLSDVAAVIEHFDLGNPFLVGHSLGGIVAALWAREHPDCPGAVSYDGIRSAQTHPDNYAGLPDDQVRAGLDELRAAFDAQEAALASALSDEALAAMRESQRQMFPDESPADFEARFERGIAVRDGRTFSRPNADVLRELRRLLVLTDVVPVLAEVTCPFLVVQAARGFGPLMPGLATLMDAHRAGLRRDLAKVTAARPNVAVTEVGATHNLVAEIPDELATLTLEFLRRQG